MKPQQTAILVALAGFLLTISVPAAAETHVGGFIVSDTYWTTAGSPYIADDSVIVIGGATLTIDPGVQVRFEPPKALMVDTGALIARGTEASPIRFTANQGSANGWGYIQFSDGTVNATFDAGGNYVSGSILEHTIVEYAGATDTRHAVRAIDSSPFIHASTVQNNAKGGILVEGSGAQFIRVEGNMITGNSLEAGGAGMSVQAQGAQLIANTITNNKSAELIEMGPDEWWEVGVGSGGGVDVRGSGCTLIGNTIRNNLSMEGGGVSLGASGSSLIGNTITNNTAMSNWPMSNYGGGVAVRGSGHTVTGNTIAHNSAVESGGGVYLAGAGCTVMGNTITNNTGDWHQAGSGVNVVCDGLGNTLTENIITNNQAAGIHLGMVIGADPNGTVEVE